jgi:acyl carrier protein phosphodiesterase
MNFLAHLYLTRNHPEKVTIGNFMADAVKGNKAFENYDPETALGIRIHRAIDDYTDKHPMFKMGTRRLHPSYGKFAPIIMDIVYDHILASNWREYSWAPLQKFADDQYELIEKHYEILPERTKRWFKFMKQNNLLYEYANEERIEFVLRLIDRRTGGISGMGSAINEISFHKDEYTEEFHLFFKDIQQYLKNRFSINKSGNNW